MDPAHQRGLQDAVARSLLSLLPDAGWGRARLFWSEVGDLGGYSRLSVRDAAGGHVRTGPPRRGLFTLLADLRETMVDPDTGTWVSCTVELSPDSRYRFTFNYDRRVYWHGEDPFRPDPDPMFGTVPADEDWRREFDRHPRRPELRPAWAPEAGPPVTDPAASGS